MMAVMTHWSLPTRGQDMPCAELCLWALSAKYARQHFGKLVLSTDDDGARLLLDGLDIQVDELHLDLTGFNPGMVSAWSLGKIETYRLMGERGEPFCHVDGDVILLKPLPDELLDAPLFAQFSEGLLHGVYPLHILGPHFPALPEPVARGIRDNVQNAYNAGIVGGSDCELFARYGRGVLDAVRDPRNAPAAVLPGTMLTLFLEQYCFGAYAADRNVVTLLDAPGEHHIEKIVAASAKRCAEVGFVHFWGNSKRNPAYAERIFARTETELPGTLDRARALTAH